MNYQQLASIYKDRKEDFSLETEALQKRYDRFSWIRLISFMIGLGIAIVLFSLANLFIAFLYVILFLVVFARFVFWHQDLLREKNHYATLVEINKNELLCLEGKFNDFDGGKEFINPLHSYSVDLDFFGNYSFFQYLNRTATAIGKVTFANYLQRPISKKEIEQRQEAGQELADKLDWRQTFQALGYAAEESLKDIDLLLDWLEDENLVLGNSKLKIGLWLLPLLTFIAIALSFFLIPYQVAVGFAVLQGYIILQFHKKVSQLLEKTTRADNILTNYATLISHIEDNSFDSKKLIELKAKFNHPKDAVPTLLQKLSKIIGQLNVRHNAFAGLLQITMLWDLQWVIRLEKWKADLRGNLPEWFEALREFDAMMSLGTMYYNHPDWSIPTIEEEGKTIIGKDLGHPLISKNDRINNDISFPSIGHIKLVTGSNMAGKSTFLRSVGLNIVFANIGAPVCARQLEIPLLKVFTSMRTQDALHESTSSFYAELKRLKVIIEAVEAQENVFFLLDEILKGTNSNDRHTGSKALIQQLIESKGVGIIATHDLELGQMEATANNTIENLCMEVAVEKDKLVFDYKIHKGVSKSFNATFLMRNMGIKV